ncbi:hypothetical protein F3Y22_tig00110637pilonHSYRG00407 [Hibiscus syriacus]|uniref:Integrase catalytic domain-containing protein n=1 Tax=Hibiscus syriacus TaxID=106335 RepID=A0A6A3A130_HIBSY|nr:hypothetical protein F3Y22_tig00110637pilonHSYRG00407 [Hibiscus syriacus]
MHPVVFAVGSSAPPRLEEPIQPPGESLTHDVAFTDNGVEQPVGEAGSTMEESYAAAVANRPGIFGGDIPLFGDEDVDIQEGDVVIDRSGPYPVVRFSSRMHGSIDHNMRQIVMVRLLGKSIGFRALWNKIHSLWKLQGRALTKGPWMVFGNYLTVQPWSRSFSTSEDHFLHVVVWVRLPGLPYRVYGYMQGAYSEGQLEEARVTGDKVGTGECAAEGTIVDIREHSSNLYGPWMVAELEDDTAGFQSRSETVGGPQTMGNTNVLAKVKGKQLIAMPTSGKGQLDHHEKSVRDGVNSRQQKDIGSSKDNPNLSPRVEPMVEGATLRVVQHQKKIRIVASLLYPIAVFRNNWYPSQIIMKAILRKNGCLAAISERPVDFTDDNKWIEMDGNAMTNFHLALADEILSSIEEKKTSKEIWDHLTKLYEATSLHNKIFLKRKLYTLREQERAELLLQSLPDSYDQLIINLTNSNFTSLVFDDVAAVVLQEENRRKNKEDRQVFRGALVVLKGKKIASNLYMLKGETLLEAEASVASCSLDSAMLWHQKLGHMLEQGMKVLVEQKLLPGLTKVSLTLCEHCITSKQHRLKFNTSNSRGKNVLELVHSNVWQAPITSLGRTKYFVSFIDDYSRRCWVYPIKKKKDVFSTFKKLKARVELDSGNKIKCFRTYNGGEYTSEEFDDFCRKEGIKRQFTVANTPQKNGVVERMNRTLLERTRAMLRDAGLEKSFWEEAVNTACYLVNRAPSTAKELKTPMEMWTGKPADYSNLHVFGSVDVKGYRLWDPTAGKVIISRDVIFVEDKLKRKEENDITEKSETTQIHMEKEVEQGDSSEAEPAHDEQEPESSEAPTTRQSDRVRRRPNWHSDYVIEGNIAYCLLTEDDEPSTYQEAINNSDASLWMMAMQEEIEALHKNNTWDLVSLPQGRKPIGNKRVFKIKRNSDDQVERHRARLVVKGYAQKEGIDFNEIFSPVVRLTTVRVVLAMCATLNLHLEQLDVKATFLHGNLEEDIYMLQPEDFEEKEKKNFVYRLNAYPCAYFKRSGDNNFVILLFPSSEEERMEMSQVPYASALGSLMFAMICTRPDIAQAVGVVSRYMANPGKEHWNTVNRILRYIKGTSNVILCYGGSNLLINGYVDSDYAGDLDKSKSTTGYMFKITGGAVTWVLKLQSVVATSTTEAEYVAATQAMPPRDCNRVRQIFVEDSRGILDRLNWRMVTVGVASPKFRRIFKQLIRDNRPDIVALFGTRTSGVHADKVISKLGMTELFYMTMVYANPRIQFQKCLWQQLSNLNPGKDQIWLLVRYSEILVALEAQLKIQNSLMLMQNIVGGKILWNGYTYHIRGGLPYRLDSAVELMHLVLNEEIHNAIFSMKPSKAPRWKGFMLSSSKRIGMLWEMEFFGWYIGDFSGGSGWQAGSDSFVSGWPDFVPFVFCGRSDPVCVGIIIPIRCNVSKELRSDISSGFQFLRVEDLGKYLGVSLHKSVTRTTYDYLIQKGRDRLASWQSKTLLLAGYKVRVKFVSHTKGLYFRTSLLPKSVCAEIKCLTQNFIRGQSYESKGHSFVSWDQFCAKTIFGLGLLEQSIGGRVNFQFQSFGMVALGYGVELVMYGRMCEVVLFGDWVMGYRWIFWQDNWIVNVDPLRDSAGSNRAFVMNGVTVNSMTGRYGSRIVSIVSLWLVRTCDKWTLLVLTLTVHPFRDDPSCSICSASVESISDVFRECTAAMAAWSVRRNRMIFEPNFADRESVLQHSNCLCLEVLDMKERHGRRSKSVKRRDRKSGVWQPPAKDWLKLNTDGGRHSLTGTTMCGGALRDYLGRWCFGFSKLVGSCSSLDANLWGIYERLELAWNFGARRIILEMDCMNIVSIFRLFIPYASPCGGATPSDWIVTVKHVYREGNRVMDALVKLAHTAPLGLNFFELSRAEVADLVSAKKCIVAV